MQVNLRWLIIDFDHLRKMVIGAFSCNFSSQTLYCQMPLAPNTFSASYLCRFLSSPFLKTHIKQVLHGLID